MIIISQDAYLSIPKEELNLPIFGYHNIIDATTISSSTAAEGYPAANVANPSTFQKWKGTSVDPDTEDYFLIPFGDYTDGVNYLGLAKHNFGTAGVRISVLGSNDAGSTFDYTLVEPFTVANDSPILLVFEEHLDINLISVVLEPLGEIAAELAVMYLGKMLRAERKIYVGHTPITMGRRLTVANGRSTSGNFLGRVVLSRKTQTAIELKNLTPSWYRSFFDPFLKAAEELPFFFAWRPDTYPLEVGFCWIPNDATPQNTMSNGMMSVSFEVEGIV